VAALFLKVGEFVSGLIDQATRTAATPRLQDDCAQGAWKSDAESAAAVGEATASEPASTSPLAPMVGTLELGAPTVEVAFPKRACPAATPAVAPEPLAPIAPTDAEKPKSSTGGWTRWTLRKLAKVAAEKFGRPVSRETIRRLLHNAGHSWKKAKKILGRADPAKRAAFVEEIHKLLDRVLHNEDLVLAYIDEAHVHQDADMGFGWSTCGERLYVASSSPGLKAKVTFFGIYLYSEPTVRIWPYERANGTLTIDVLERLRREHRNRPIIVVWDGASYHRSQIVRDAAERLKIQLVRLPPYSPDFMPVEALWHWLREEVTYNFCHDTPRELIERVERFVETICSDVCALADRLSVKDELDPDEEKVRFST
jgi:transposase